MRSRGTPYIWKEEILKHGIIAKRFAHELHGLDISHALIHALHEIGTLIVPGGGVPAREETGEIMGDKTSTRRGNITLSFLFRLHRNPDPL